MTNYLAAYVSMLAGRDLAMLKIAVMALGSVLGWYSIVLLPLRWRKYAESIYLAAGLLAAGAMWWIQH